MEKIEIGSFDHADMPPEPPQLRAEEVGQGFKPKREKSRRPELKQPERKEKKKEEVVEVKTPAENRAEAMRPKLDRPVVVREGKIARRTPKGQARPL